MPHYDYDKDYPFAAFITNLGKYNEGALVGEWVKFPTTAEELKQVFERIGIDAKDDFGQTYEEWFITDYDCYVDGLYDLLGEYANLDELNYLASKLDDMSQDEYERFQAAVEIGDHTSSIQELINLTENLDCYDIYPDIHDHDDLGRYYIEELDAMQVPEHLRNYIDYEAYGRDIALEESGQFTDLGYVRDTGDSFHEYYDGERGSIPEEYRVMTFQDDIPEEEISEWAMDLAYDMDEFFRQNDPQYAAEHPEEHAAKEEIYENLMAGRISALDEKLAALGQTQEDYLPSEIEKFKDATGYEECLDVDLQVIREAIENPDQSHVDEIFQAGGHRDQPIDGGFQLCLVAGAVLCGLMLNIALALVLAGDDDGQAVLFAQPVAGPAYLVIAAFVGMVVLVVCEADRIKNQMVVNMPLINMGGKYKLVLATQYFFCQLHPDLMGFLGGNLPRLKGLNQVAAQVGALVDGMAAGPLKFNVRCFGGAAIRGNKQLSIRLDRIADIVNGRFQR